MFCDVALVIKWVMLQDVSLLCYKDWGNVKLAMNFDWAWG